MGSSEESVRRNRKCQTICIVCNTVPYYCSNVYLFCWLATDFHLMCVLRCEWKIQLIVEIFSIYRFSFNHFHSLHLHTSQQNQLICTRVRCTEYPHTSHTKKKRKSRAIITVKHGNVQSLLHVFDSNIRNCTVQSRQSHRAHDFVKYKTWFLF